jgi:predicted oxidoreductase
MKQILGSTGLEVSRIGLGCMRMVALESSDAVRVIQTCLENGINFFDHADIYGGGQSEVRFAQAMKELGLDREKLVIQSKCGIRKGFFDFFQKSIS